ncbi:rod shape-determining protein MreC [bacterium]|nr:rod shape-determining protein MreC [bacterium]
MKVWQRLGLALAIAVLARSWLEGLGWYDRVAEVRGQIYQATRGGQTASLNDLQAQVSTLQAENDRLRLLLKLPRQGWRLSLTARCLYRSGENASADLWVNRGRLDGVTLNTVALHSAGLVGRVVEVRPHQCRIRPALHPNSRVPVLLGELQGVARGRGWSLEVDQIRSRPSVTAGVWVTTSGLGQVFPGSILVGRVRRSLPSSEPMFARYEVEPSVFLDQVLEVLLVELSP